MTNDKANDFKSLLELGFELLTSHEEVEEEQSIDPLPVVDEETVLDNFKQEEDNSSIVYSPTEIYLPQPYAVSILQISFVLTNWNIRSCERKQQTNELLSISFFVRF